MNARMTDFEIGLNKIQYLSTRVNEGLLFILVINGELTVETDERYYQLEEKDLLVLNRNQSYQIRGSKENSVLILNISDAFIEHHYEGYRTHRFKCYSREVDMGRELMLSKIRKLLAELMISYCRKDESYGIEIQGYICEILLILIRRFKQEGSAFEKIDTDDQRLKQIITYMEKNYDQMITLEDMAERFHLSIGYLSRYFKQKMDMGFSRFLMHIRLKHSMKDMLYTTNSISQIALNNGFPNTKSFTSLFKEVYGETPHVYRENHALQKIDLVQSYDLQDAAALINSPEIMTKLGMLLSDNDKSYSNTETRFEELNLDLSGAMGHQLNLPDNVLTIGELKELLKEEVRSQVLMVKADMNLQYIGIRNLLSGTTISPPVETDESIATTSPYFNSDAALNFMKSHDLSLFARIDYKEIVVDEEKYFKKLKDFLRHCIQQYGHTYVSKWHFMFYEPYITAVEADHLHQVYLSLYHLLKQQAPGIQVGTFLPLSIPEGVTNDSHSWQLEESAHIDFIGYHANQNEAINFNEMVDDRFYISKQYVKEKTNKVKAYLKQHRMEKPLHLVTWNTLSGNTRFTNGTFFRGALVLKNALDVANDVKSIGFWINTELHERGKGDQRIQIEGLELFHYFSGKRPVYYAMLFLKKLQGQVIAQGSDYIMTQNERGYQLVLMNCNNINPYFSLEETFVRKLNKDIRVTITGLQAGEYQVRKHIFDKDNGALYTKWWNMNNKQGMDTEIIDYIIRSTHPSLEIFDEMIAGDWSFYSYLTINAIHFFDIRRSL